VRAAYAGQLTYAANAVSPADEFTSVSFWPQVDLLGLDAYTPLTNKTNPTRPELVAAWRRNREGHEMVAAYRNFQAAHGKPPVEPDEGGGHEGEMRASSSRARRARAASIPATPLPTITW
jgi:hypothetical protein